MLNKSIEYIQLDSGFLTLFRHCGHLSDFYSHGIMH
jgi:hypothetical protein